MIQMDQYGFIESFDCIKEIVIADNKGANVMSVESEIIKKPDTEKDKLELPIHLEIETARGCNAKCVMCPLNYAEDELKLETGIMSIDTFKKIIDNYIPYVNKIKYVTLLGIGEPLLDKTLSEKVRYLKNNNFKNIATATNADLLNEKRQSELLEDGIDTIICSVDGIDKKTHEEIRLNTKFERVINNIQSCIKKRNEGNFKTRFLIRMIRQDSNIQQWPAYVEYWENFIDRSKKDDVIAFDVHTWGGTRLKEKGIEYYIPCPLLLEKSFISFNGDIHLCFSSGILKKTKIGNALTEDPISVYNDKIAKYHRVFHRKGLRGYLHLCQGCNIPDQRRKRILTTDTSKQTNAN
jgi:MoaA/NifB/PqqE/SkfB family radical SAM enzyme